MSPEIVVQKGWVKDGALGVEIGLRLLKGETSEDLLGLPFNAINSARLAWNNRNIQGVKQALEPLIGREYSGLFSKALKKGVEGASVTFKEAEQQGTDRRKAYKVIDSKNLSDLG